MSDSPNLKVKWLDRGVEPQCAPDPAYPNGLKVDGSSGAAVTCETSLPYPARRCGYYEVSCELCGLSVLITTAGRVDDPKWVKLACHPVAVPGKVQ